MKKNDTQTKVSRNIDNISLMTSSQDSTNIETNEDIASKFHVLLSSREPECAEIGWIGAVPHLSIQIRKIICCVPKCVPKYEPPPPITQLAIWVAVLNYIGSNQSWKPRPNFTEMKHAFFFDKTEFAWGVTKTFFLQWVQNPFQFLD